MDPLDDLAFCFEVLQRQRFDGLDQNPKGIRDLMYSAIERLKVERARAKRTEERLQKLMVGLNAAKDDPRYIGDL